MPMERVEPNNSPITTLSCKIFQKLKPLENRSNNIYEAIQQPKVELNYLVAEIHIKKAATYA